MNSCIICKQQAELTVEHIVPEFMGGSLTFQCVCKPCNDSMGEGFEGRLSNNFIYKAFRYIHKIKGKSETPYPFDQTYLDQETELKYRMDRTGKITSLPKSSLTETQNGLEFSLTIDEKELGKAEEIIEKKIGSTGFRV